MTGSPTFYFTYTKYICGHTSNLTYFRSVDICSFVILIMILNMIMILIMILILIMIMIVTVISPEYEYRTTVGRVES